MDFRILGPLAVHLDGVDCPVGGVRQQAVLAALLLRANRIASVGSLAEAVWEVPPATPASNLRTYISGLRQCLPGGADRILTRPGGYLLVVAEDELDLTVVERHLAVADAARQAGDASRAAREYGQAVALWRGRPLDGLACGSPLAAEITRLTELRLSALERHVESRLALGQHSELVGELRTLVAEHPLREQLWVYLLQALHGSGRRADALLAYQEVYQLLDTELGVQPGAALRELHAQMLMDDPVQVVTPRQPRQLPALVQPYLGRVDELAEAEALLRGGAVVIATGPPGVGKTAFAAQVAHRLSEQFPDGQLWVDLRGADEDPQEPAGVLAQFLRDLGVAGMDVPLAVHERSALLRAHLAERRVLLVLDNAATEAQIRPLLPDCAGSAVLVTSRSRLTGLDTTARIRLDALGLVTAVRLLDRLAGTVNTSTDKDRATVTRVAQLCGGLPLALRIVGTKLRSLPHLNTAGMARRLAEEQHRLDELVSGDRELRASFHISYSSLPAPVRRAFRLLSLIPGPSFPAWAAAAVCGCDLRTAERFLDHLVEANLVECVWGATGRVRYHFHDLLRLFAGERALSDCAPDERAAATHRVNAAYLHVAHHADARLEFGGMARQHPPAVDLGEPGLLDELVADAPAWFDEELPILLAIQDNAAHTGRDELTCQLTGFLMAHLELRAQWDHLQRAGQLCLLAAQRMNSPYWTVSALFALGLAARERHDLARSAELFEQCLQLLPDVDDGRLDMLVRLAVGVGLRLRGSLSHAARCFDDCLRRLRQLDLPRWQAYTMREFGVLHRYGGDWLVADRYLREAVAGFAQLGDRRWLAASMQELGIVRLERANSTGAANLLYASQATFAELGDRRREAGAWRSLAVLHLRSGDVDTALTHATRSCDLYSQTLDRFGKACAQIVLGEIHVARGEYRLAHDMLRTGLSAVESARNDRWAERARAGLARLRSLTHSTPVSR